jgi:Flp pilus assembly protein TadB
LLIKIFDFYKNICAKKRMLFAILFHVFIAAVVYIFFSNIIFSIFLAVCIFFIISSAYSAVNEKRLEVLHGQLIEFAINIIVMVKAGKSVRSIVRESVLWTKPPLNNYIRQLADELKTCFSFNESMDNFAKRCFSREARLISTALKLNNSIGGDLVFILGNIVETLQESLKVRSAARSFTLQSRYSANIIAFMPVAVLVAMFFFMNETTREFFSSRTGNILLAAGSILEIAGIIITGSILKEPPDNSGRDMAADRYRFFKDSNTKPRAGFNIKNFLIRIAGRAGIFFERFISRAKIDSHKENFRIIAEKMPFAADYRVLIGLKFTLSFLFIFISAALMKNIYSSIIAAAAAGIAGFFIVDILIKRISVLKSAEFTKDLPYIIDLLYISAMSGQNIYNCLKILVENHRSSAAAEIGVFLKEINSGMGRFEAYNNFISRNNVENFRNLIFLILQAEKYGSSINEILRQKSKFVRFEISQKSEIKSRRASVLLLFPLAFLILPAFVMLVGGPLIITVSGGLFVY